MPTLAPAKQEPSVQDPLLSAKEGPLGLGPIRTEFPGISSAPSHELIPNAEARKMCQPALRDHKSEPAILKGHFWMAGSPAHSVPHCHCPKGLTQTPGAR